MTLPWSTVLFYSRHQADNPDDKALHRPRDYSLSSYPEKIVQQLCGFEE